MTDEQRVRELAIIREAYENDEILSPLDLCVKLLPHRSRDGMGVTASNHGWTRERAERRRAKGLSEHAPRKSAATSRTDAEHEEAAQRPSSVKSLVTYPAPTPKPPRQGPCDRGDREAIRKRLVQYEIPSLARELDRTPEEIAKTIQEIAKDGFRSENPLGAGYTARDLAEALDAKEAA